VRKLPIALIPLLLLCMSSTVRNIAFDNHCLQLVWALGADDYEKVVEEGEKALWWGVYDHQALLVYGVGLAGLGRTQEAREAFLRVLEYHPKFTNALTNIGLTYDREGKYERALDYYRQVLEVNPRHYICLYNLGTTLHRIGNVDSAMACYKAAIRSNHTVPAVNLGGIFLRRGQLDSCIIWSAKALSPGYESWAALVNMGRAYSDLGDYDTAAKTYLWFLQAYQGSDAGLKKAAADEYRKARRMADGH
jgi:tetratricopeptide (TPR) repeat protein